MAKKGEQARRAEEAQRDAREQELTRELTSLAKSRRQPRAKAPAGPLHPKSAALMLRVSTTEQADSGLSLGAQQERLRAYAALHGLEIVAVYCDAGVSAKTPLKDRPEGRLLVEAIERGEVAHVLAVSLDRIFRRVSDCLVTMDAWSRRGVAVHFLNVGGATVNTKTAMGEFFLTLMAGVAQLERATIGERVRATVAQGKAKGVRYGRPPLGFRVVSHGAPLEPVPEELEVVRTVLASVERGASFHRIAAELTSSGAPTKAGGARWQPAAVRRLWLSRDRYTSYLGSTYAQ